ncbi:hypothetical protein GGR25_004001 [Kaistia hirudinis]|uniref:Hemerythrin-like domain-containing protein n=1 Tax=Kaistia hirudinis TaxID=1293440 RepID=A0A840AV60_9HYPH|nr:hypothetical protein [Kaistia hirudinis]MBB3932937.1 hypothetical protein [Kaistia hirudinis]MBN9019500.1 hypothetical protein [Hyphomicrobiales bacterium]
MNAHAKVDTAASAIYVDESRYNLYTMPHKALRRAQMLLLTRLGALDADDTAAVAALVADMRMLNAAGRGHLEHENIHIHQVIEAHVIGATEQLAEEHEEHERDFDELDAMLARIETAPAAELPGLLRGLYLRYSLFIADDLQHMAEEETETLSLLHQLFGDAELRAIEQRIVSSIDAETMMGFLRLMMPAMNHGERLEMLGGMKAAMPAPIFAMVCETNVKPFLEANAWRKLESALASAN